MFFKWKKKKSQDKILEAFAEAFRESTQKANEIGPILLAKQRPEQADFGLCATNPIFTSSLAGTEQYLSRLCTKDGKKFTWSPYISVQATIDEYTDIGEDKYTLFLDGKEYADLYFILYLGESTFPPAGLYFSDDSTDWDLEREALSKGISAYQLREQRRKEKAEQELLAKAAIVKNVYPECDIISLVENPLFVFLERIEFDLVKAYEYIHKDKYFVLKENKPEEISTTYSAQHFYDLLCKSESKPQVRDCRTMSSIELQTAASKAGLDILTFASFNKLEVENAEMKWNARLKQFKKYAEQAVETKATFPSFDLIDDLKDFTFDRIADKFGVFTAHEICHFHDYYIPKVHKEEVHIENEEKSTEEIFFCRKCGTKLFSDSTFCHKCGTKVERDAI